MKKDAFFIFTVAFCVILHFNSFAQRVTEVTTMDLSIPAGTPSTSSNLITFRVEFKVDFTGADHAYSYLAAVRFETTDRVRTRDGESLRTEFRWIGHTILVPSRDTEGRPDRIATYSVLATEGIPVNRLIQSGQGYCRNAQVFIYRIDNKDLSNRKEREGLTPCGYK